MTTLLIFIYFYNTWFVQKENFVFSYFFEKKKDKGLKFKTGVFANTEKSPALF